MAQTWRSVLEIPRVLFPASKSTGTVKPIIGPATYHGHGCRRNSITFKIKHFIQLQNYLKGVEQFIFFNKKVKKFT